MSDERTQRRRRIVWIIAGTTAVVALVAFGVTALLVNIFERKVEARNPFYRVVDLTDETEDPQVWGKNFPIQYEGYMRTVDQQRTRYGGSEAVPRTPTEADPRTIIAQSRLEEDPRLKTMWSGYAFAVDFREERGHAYMLEDQTFTGRQEAAQQPGACIHCHASVYVPYKKLGDGDLMAGFEKMNPMPYPEARKHVTHPVTCIDCHDPETMALRITRPGFLEGIRVLKATEGVEDYDPNTMASRQEMRSFVCGQCHVEYYFRGAEKRLVYPWHRGLKADEILSYYEEETDHRDWTHAITGAAALKAQHPEFEMWNQGIHARSGVACADCHMPYTRVGAMKVSDHWVRSPVLNVDNACRTCHHWTAEELKDRVYVIQARTYEMRNRAIDALVDLIEDIDARSSGAEPAHLGAALGHQRKAQFLIDFIEAENSMGFHAPQEAARILTLAIDHVRLGQIALREGPSAPAPSRALDPISPGAARSGR